MKESPPESVFPALAEARRRLGVERGADPGAVKRAYRSAVAEHPPDRDPDAFQQIREAYELLSDPVSAARAWVDRPVPSIAPPAIERPAEPPPREPLAVVLLRAVVGRLDRSTVLAMLERPAGSAGSEVER